ncbi:MAG: hypothetical protein A4E70_02099 [Syntrophus sp. PtaU1.Bin005]|mgnify:FL=1|jgi:hypothetical protein|uniref:hypothetical protein n=1 Tax=Syntrophus TaxID=43773 RepID=UPI0009CFFB10|nr:MAG: hypothetical protein A4E70_02099 [Syntrophus sp. PtaU1.Bin005]
MDTLLSINLSIPLIQIALLLIMSTAAVLFGRIKLALILNYGFILYWAYILNMNVIRESGQAVIDQFTLIYFGFGFVILLLASVGFFAHHD